MQTQCNLKKTAIALCLLGLNFSASAQINEKPIEDKQYNNFLIFDDNGSKQASFSDAEAGKTKNYYFNDGALFDGTSGHEAAIIVRPGNTHNANTYQIFNVGQGKNLTVKQYESKPTIHIDKGATAKILGGNIILESGMQLKEWDPGKTYTAVLIENEGRFVVSAENFIITNKSEDKPAIGAIDIRNGSNKLNERAKVEINLTGKFFVDNVSYGIYSGLSNNSLGNDISIHADSGIDITTTNINTDGILKPGYQLSSYGIWINANNSDQSNSTLELISSQGDISINAKNVALVTVGNVETNLSANNIILQSREASGLNIDGRGYLGEVAAFNANSNIIVHGKSFGGFIQSSDVRLTAGKDIQFLADGDRIQGGNALSIEGSKGAFEANGSIIIQGTYQGCALSTINSTNTFYAKTGDIILEGTNKYYNQGQGFFSTNSQNTFSAKNISVKGGFYKAGINLTENSKAEMSSDTLSVLSPSYWAIYLSKNSSFNSTTEGITSLEGKIQSSSQSSLNLTANSLILTGNTSKNSSLITAKEASSISVIVTSASSLVSKESKNLMSSTGANSLIDIRSSQLTMLGSINATDQGSIVINGSKVEFTGATSLTNESNLPKGSINLDFGKDSVWHLTDNSEITSLSSSKTTLNFSGIDSSKQVGSTPYHQLTMEKFNGENNVLNMRVNLREENNKDILMDQMIITESAQGNNIANLIIDGKNIDPVKTHSVNWLISQGSGSNMTLLNKDGTNYFSGNGMVTTWALSFVADGDENKLDNLNDLGDLVNNTNGTGSGKWYLINTDAIPETKPEPNPDPQPDPQPQPNPDPEPEAPKPNDPAEIQQITNLGISATQALSFASELEDLRSRLGEVRYGAQDGAWVRAGYAKETADGYNGRGFEQKTHDLHIGLDRIVAADEDSSWLVGGALRYAKSKQEGFTAARGGEGVLEQYSAKLYATYMHAQGSYADFVVQAGRYSQDLTGLANDLSSAFSADYKTYGYGASIEVGHMFDFNNQVDDRQWFNHFFIEPQLQLSYFNAHGKDYKTSTGLAVSQSDADFLTGRAGVVLGKKFNYGTADDLDKRYFQVGLKGGVKYEFLGDQTIRFTGVERVTKERKADDVEGARYYYGVTADWQLSNNFRAYATVEREEGDHYTKDFDVSVGVKYQF